MAKRRGPLTRDEFAKAALAFIDEHGVDACTLNALGAAVGVHGTALYRHFRDKDELLDCTLEYMLTLENVKVATEGTARDRLTTTLLTLRKAFARHPNFALPYLRSADEQVTAPLVMAALALLEEMGLSGRELIVTYQILESVLVGFNAYDFSDSPEGMERRHRSRRLTPHPEMDATSRRVEDVQAIADEAFVTAINAVLDACQPTEDKRTARTTRRTSPLR